MEAVVIGVRGKRSLVETPDGQKMECLSGRQQSRCCCGDRILIKPLKSGQCALETILTRKSVLYRADPFKKKLLAANITQVGIVVAVTPSFSEELITRIQVAATIEHIRPFIIFNKIDLTAGYDLAKERLVPFQKIGLPIIETAIGYSIEGLKAILENEFTLLIGQSGMGKSTLLNTLIPSAQAETRSISEALNSGRHTTTASTLYKVQNQPLLVDSPGLQHFGLYGYDRSDIECGFVEFAPYLGHCRFADCRHHKEPGCAIVEAVKEGKIDAQRLSVYHRILEENAFNSY